MTLIEFLEARIAEDEATASAASQGIWHREPPSHEPFARGDESVYATSDDWYSCEYFCRWPANATTSRGAVGQPGHEHLRSDTVIGSWGYDADGVEISAENEAHILAWQPSRVLAECAAKRAIIAALDLTHCPCARSEHCVVHDSSAGPPEYAVGRYLDYTTESVLAALAAPYASHPDFDPSWAGEATP